MALIKTINRNGEILTPNIAPDVFMAENATVVGDVTVGEGTSLWFNSVLRGDVNTITIGKHCNIQDGTVLHTLYQKSTITLGDYVSVGHNVTIHGATIKDNALIGMGSVVLDHAVVGEGAIVAAGSVVTGKTVIGPGEMWAGVPAKYIKNVDPAQSAEMNQRIARDYHMYASWYTESDEKQE